MKEVTINTSAPRPRRVIKLLTVCAALLCSAFIIPAAAQTNSWLFENHDPLDKLLAPQASRPDILWMRGGHTSLTNQTFYAPDGEKVVVGTNGQVKVFRPSDGTLLLTVNSVAAQGDCTNPMMSSPFAISPNSRKLAVMVDAPQPVGKAIQFWDMATGALDSSISVTVNSGVSYSPDGTRLIAGRTIYSTANNSLAYTFPAGKFPAFFSQNQQFIYGSIDNNSNCDGNRSIIEFNGSNYLQIRTIGAGIPQAISPNGALIINSYPGNVIRISDGAIIHSLEQSGPNPYHNYKFSPDGQYVAVGRSYARDINNGQPLVIIKRTSDWSTLRSYVADDYNVNSDRGNVSVSFSPDSQMLAVSNWTTRLWSVSDGSLIRELNSTFAGGFSSLAFSSDGQILAAANSSSYGYPTNQYLSLLNVADGSRRSVSFPDSLGSSFNKVSFADNNQKLVTWQGYFYTSNSTIKVWDAANGTVLRQSDSTNYAGFTVAPNGQEMAVATGQIEIQNIATGAVIKTFGGGYQRGDYPLAYSPDGQFIAASSTSYYSLTGIKLWRISDGVEIRDFQNSGCCTVARINGSSAFSPDGQMFAAATEATNNFPRSSEIKLWRVSDGALLRTITGFTNWAGSLAFSSDGQYIFATGWDATVRIFRVSDGAQVNLYTTETGFQPGSNYTLGQIAVSPDGSRFAYARADAAVVMGRNPYSTTPPTTFTVSGQITRGGSALSNVSVALSGSSSNSATTDAGGNYSFTVNEGGSYTVTPTLAGNNFTPPSRTFNFVSQNQTADFAASLITYTISGNVKADGANLSGATVSLSGGQTTSTTTDLSGNYTFTVPAGANYAVSVYKNGINFNPASQSFTNLNANQIANFQNGVLYCTPAPSGLIAWYKGENNALDSAGTNNGSVFNGVTYPAAKVGQGFNFNGQNQYAEFTNSSAFNLSRLSISTWVYIDPNDPWSRNSLNVIVGKNPGTTNAGGFVLSQDDRRLSSFPNETTNTLRFQVSRAANGGEASEINLTNAFPSAGWYYIGATFDGTTSRLYLNGTLVGTGSPIVAPTFNDLPLRIGAAHVLETYGVDDRFKGQIDETQIYNRALSASEIAAIYNAGSAGVCSVSCVDSPNDSAAFYKGENNVNDSSGNGNNGFAANGAGYTAGKVGQGFNPTSFGEYFYALDSASISPTSRISLEAWVKPTSNASGAIISKYERQPNQVSYYLGLTGGKVQLTLSSNGSNARDIFSVDSVVPVGAFTHIAATFDTNGQDAHLYVNGVEVANEVLGGSSTISSIFDSNSWLRLGGLRDAAGNHNGQFIGVIDEAKVFSRVLSPSEIQVIVNAGNGVGCQGTTVYTPKLSNGKIAFHNDRTGNQEIYTMNSDASNETNISNNSAADYYPDWSPDGTKIVFSSNRDGNDEIYLMNSDGTSQVRLTSNSFSDIAPQWSPDGTKIVFHSNRGAGGATDIILMNADGSNQTALTSNSSFNQFPRWSPDGSKIIFQSRRDVTSQFSPEWYIYVMNANGSSQTRLTNSVSGIKTDINPTWSPDGSKIAFVRVQTNAYVYLMNADGSNQTYLSFGQAPEWSPDGTKVIFRAGGCFTTIKPDGSEYMNLPCGGGTSNYPSWQSIRSNIAVAPANNLNLIFSNVSQAGNTVATPLTAAQIPALPSNYALFTGAPIYDIRTSVVYAGSITVTHNVPNVVNGAICSGLRMLHYENGAWTTDTNVTPVYNAGTQICTLAQTVTSLSPFAVAQPIAPTAAGVTISGRVITPVDLGLTGALVTLTDSRGNAQTTITRKGGVFVFRDITPNETHILTVSSKRYSYAPLVITPTENLVEINLIPQQIKRGLQ